MMKLIPKKNRESGDFRHSSNRKYFKVGFSNEHANIMSNQ